jgi:hypothetical protein
MEEKRSLHSIPDDELLQGLANLMGQSRRVEADLVAHIAEVDARKLYARAAFPSMFGYCKEVLHLSEPEAYLRITTARASRKHPMLLKMLGDGRLHLTAIALLAPHLTRENREGLLQRATHRSKHQIEELVAEIAPRPDVPAVMRQLPERRTQPTADLPVMPKSGSGPILDFGADPRLELRPDGVAVPESGGRPRQLIALASDQSPDSVQTEYPHRSASFAPSHGSRSVIEPLSPGRYKVQFTASADFRNKLERLRALAPDGDLAAVIEQAVTEKLERLEARRFARTKALNNRQVPPPAMPRPHHEGPEQTKKAHPGPSRYIPAAIRRAVHKRDQGRCSYVDEQGQRCPERNRLQYHHRHPYGLGGEHSVANIGLMCRAHNAYLAECDFGTEAIARHRRAEEPSHASASAGEQPA